MYMLRYFHVYIFAYLHIIRIIHIIHTFIHILYIPYKQSFTYHAQKIHIHIYISYFIDLKWVKKYMCTYLHSTYVDTNSLTPTFPISFGVALVLSKIEQISSTSRSPLAVRFINDVLPFLNIADVELQPLQACIDSILLTMTGSCNISDAHQLLNLILLFVSFHENFSLVTVPKMQK